jgi:hypothetical protein
MSRYRYPQPEAAPRLHTYLRVTAPQESPDASPLRNGGFHGTRYNGLQDVCLDADTVGDTVVTVCSAWQARCLASTVVHNHQRRHRKFGPGRIERCVFDGQSTHISDIRTVADAKRLLEMAGYTCEYQTSQ